METSLGIAIAAAIFSPAVLMCFLYASARTVTCGNGDGGGNGGANAFHG